MRIILMPSPLRLPLPPDEPFSLPSNSATRASNLSTVLFSESMTSSGVGAMAAREEERRACPRRKLPKRRGGEEAEAGEVRS